MKVFVGSVSLNQSFKSYAFSPYQNPIVVSEGNSGIVENLIQLHVFRPDVLHNFIWVIFTNGDVTTKLQHLPIPYNGKFLLVINNEFGDLEIRAVYQIASHFPKEYPLFAFWRNGGLKTDGENIFSGRSDLMGHQISIVIPEYAEQKPKLWVLLSDALNFTMKVFPVNFTSLFYPNGTKTGIFQMVYQGVMDASDDQFMVTSDRLKYFDFIFPTSVTEYKIYVASSYGFNWMIFATPFTASVWIAMVAWILLVWFSISIIKSCSKFRIHHPENSLINVLKILCYQSGNVTDSRIPIRICYLMHYLVAIILLQYYSGVLLSYVAVKRLYEPFTNLEEVIEDESFKISTIKDAFITTYFQYDNGPGPSIIRNKGLLVPEEDLALEHNAAFEKICNNRWVLICDEQGFRIQTICDINEVPTAVSQLSGGIMVRNGFPYTKIMTQTMKKLQFSGLLKLKQNNVFLKPNDQQEFKPTSLRIVVPLFAMILRQIIVSIAVCIFENWIRIFFSRKRKNKNVKNKNKTRTK